MSIRNKVRSGSPLHSPGSTPPQDSAISTRAAVLSPIAAVLPVAFTRHSGGSWAMLFKRAKTEGLLRIHRRRVLSDGDWTVTIPEEVEIQVN